MTYEHIYTAGKTGRPTFLLLHGTGGNENDLVPLAKMIDPEAGILSLRGDLSENGMNRFFRRLAEGIFDHEDLEKRTKNLYQFVNDAAEEHGFDRGNVVALGYSNGANIAASLLYFYDDAVKGALLHHPMVPFRDHELLDQTGLPVFIGAGKNDPICPPQETRDLSSMLEKAGSDVTTYWGEAGHSLTQEELQHAKAWYNEHFSS